MQETPSTEITHAPSGSNSSCEYHGYILRFPGQFNVRSFHVYNCKDKGDKIDGFNILNYIGPMNLIISLDNANTYYVLWNVNLTGEESGYTSRTSNKIYETRALSFSNVNNYTSVQISDGYTTTSFLATVKFDSFTFQFQIPYNYSSLVFNFDTYQSSPATLTLDQHENKSVIPSDVTLSRLDITGGNVSYSKIVISSTSLFSISYSTSFACVFGFTEWTIEIDGSEFPFNMFNLPAHVILILHKSTTIKSFAFNFFTDLTIKLDSSTSSASIKISDCDFGWKDYNDFYMASGVNLVFGKLTNFPSWTSKYIPLHWHMKKFSEKYECGQLTFTTLPQYEGTNSLILYIDHEDSSHYYTKSEISSKFPTTEMQVVSCENREINVELASDVTIPGFYEGQSIMTSTTSGRVKFDPDKLSLFPLSICLTFDLGTVSDCKASSMKYYLTRVLNMSLPISQMKALDPDYPEKVLNLSLNAPSDLNGIEIGYYITSLGFDSMNFKIPTLDLTKLNSDLKNKDFFISAADGAYARINVLGLSELQGNISLNNLNLNYDLDVSTLSINDNVNSVSLTRSSFNFKLKPTFNEKVTFYYNSDDVAKLFASDFSISVYQLRYWPLGKSILVITGLEPLQIAGLFYGNSTRIKLRVTPVVDVVPVTIQITASKVLLTVDYLSQDSFSNNDEYRLLIEYDGKETAENVVNFNLTNFIGYAEILTAESDVDWPDSFRSQEIITLNPGNSTITNVLMLLNYTGPYIRNSIYKVSNTLASRVQSKVTTFKLGDRSSNLPEVKFPDMSFDILLSEDNETKITKISGCKAIFDNLEIKYDTISEFDSLQVNNNLTMYPGSVLRPSGYSSNKRILDDGTNSENSNTDVCDIFGTNVNLRWNSDTASSVILSSNCQQQDSSKTTKFTFQYDDTLLPYVFNATNFKNNYMGENQKTVISGFIPSSSTKESLNKSSFIGPTTPNKEWKHYEPEMEVNFTENKFFIRTPINYSTKWLSTMKDLPTDPPLYTELLQKHYVKKDGAKGNGLMLIIVVALVFLIVVIGIWSVMFFLYKDTLVELGNSSYSSAESLTYSKSSGSGSSYEKKKESSSGSGSSV
ncbi:hypothetical protein TVAG_172120 [Trichomonas vaginalis G3]|uniref:Uncharacterized protein n=1 Tax=Trichomonas vaginalis (strain ATCC PRA-98 / G3) TaxID=412133 RepID=A2DEW3_TRIV3|nr:hypothetical protein TVAGG3_0530640 [Trichomonas vaginalis G3]EAY20955.1 hypothetical protein TVAG_172120 [Trichomonas vaginalis G3]KAI5519114.1 hypothetical protein TVAGG3_0530640 [Trichomonas vaginalis G3]|eukprot:XP_001581941.1 hypothetical protein [Trichomonas vaginalis G3]